MSLNYFYCFKSIMLFSIFTVGISRDGARRWARRVQVVGCCTGQAEWTFRYNHGTCRGDDHSTTVSPLVTRRRIAIRTTRQYITGWERSSRRADANCRRATCKQSCVYVTNISITYFELKEINLAMITFHYTSFEIIDISQTITLYIYIHNTNSRCMFTPLYFIIMIHRGILRRVR